MLAAYKELKEPINQHIHGNHLRNELVSWVNVRRTKPWVTILLYPRARKWLPKIMKFRGLLLCPLTASTKYLPITTIILTGFDFIIACGRCH